MKAIWCLLSTLGLVACGSVGNSTPDGPPGDDEHDADPTPIDAADPDAGPVARCNLASPFGQPVAVAGVNSGSDDFPPFLTADELTMLFGSNRPGSAGGIDIYIATRTSIGAAFGTPTLLNGVNTAESESRPVLTADGLTLYAETFAAGSNWQISVATRASTAASFGALAPVTQLNTTAHDVAPFVMADHSAMYLVSHQSGNADIYRATRVGTTWQTPVLASGTMLSSVDGEDHLALTPDDLAILFTSVRAGGVGSNDVWLATRASVVSGFSAPVNVAAVNTAASENAGWLSADGCVLYFIRNIGVAASNYDIFVATRPL